MAERGPHHEGTAYHPDDSAREARQQEMLYYNRERNLGPPQQEDKEENPRKKLLIEDIDAEQKENEWRKAFPFGDVIKPFGGTLLDHKRVLLNSVTDEGGSLAFSARNYPAFDDILVQECGLGQTGVSLSPAFNPNHPAYKDFAPLRRNIAILRNYLLVQYFSDGAYTPEDPGPAGVEDTENLKKIEEMAHTLGKALAGNTAKSSLIPRFCRSLLRLITGKPLATPDVSDFMKQANLPDAGLDTMYELLFSKKENKSSWGLLPRDETPFSDANLQRFGHTALLASCADHCDEIVRNFNEVHTLDGTQKVIAVEEGRNILDKLKIMLASGLDGAEISEIGDPELTKAVNLTNAVSSMQADLAMLTQQDPHDRMNIRLMEEGKALAGQANQNIHSMASNAAVQEKSVKPPVQQQRSDDRRNVAQRTANVRDQNTVRTQGVRIQQDRHHSHNRQQQAQRQVSARHQQTTKITAPAPQPATKPQPAPVPQNTAALLAARSFAMGVGDTMSSDAKIAAAGAATEAQRQAAITAAQQATARREARKAQERARQLKAQLDAAAAKKAPQTNR